MIKIKLNTKSFDIPTTWEEVAFSQWTQMTQMPDGIFNIISIFTGILPEVLKSSTIIGVDKIVTAISFTNKKPVMPGYVDKVGKYKLPPNVDGKFDIQYKSLGQFEDAREVYKTMEGDKLLPGYGKLVAIYLQELRDGEYDSFKVHELELEVQNMPAIEVITAGAFFFLKSASLFSGTPTVSLLTPRSQKRSKQGLKTTLKPSGSTRKLTRSRGR